MKDEETSNAILKNIKNYLSSLPFNFQNASIISGQEEGLYGWITVNYLKGNFLEVSSWAVYCAEGIFWFFDIEQNHIISKVQRAFRVLWSFYDTILNLNQKYWTLKILNFSLFYRKIFGMPGYILMGLRQLAHWTWVEPPPRLPLPLLKMPKVKISLRFHSMAMNTTSIHTASSAMGKMKLRREFWPNF